MADKAKNPKDKPKSKKTWWGSIYGKSKKPVKGLGEAPETNAQGAVQTLVAVGSGLGGGVIGSAVGGTKGFVLGLGSVVAGIFTNMTSLTSAGVGAMLGSMIQKPIVANQKEQSYSEKAKANSSYFIESFKSVTMLDQLGKKKEEEIKVKVDASNTASNTANATTTTANQLSTGTMQATTGKAVSGYYASRKSMAGVKSSYDANQLSGIGYNANRLSGISYNANRLSGISYSANQLSGF